MSEDQTILFSFTQSYPKASREKANNLVFHFILALEEKTRREKMTLEQIVLSSPLHLFLSPL